MLGMSFPTRLPPPLQALARNRVVVGYAVDPGRVAAILPQGLVPARHNGTSYVSLVGVELTDIRLRGLAVPGCRRVSVVELRAHVWPTKSPSGPGGTWTIRAHMSRRLAAWGTRLLCGEQTEVTSMQPVRREQVDHVEVTYRFDWKGREQRIRVRGERPPVMPAPETRAHALLTPTWRFGTARDGTLLQTRLDRPATPVYRVQEHHVTVQGPAVYGDLGSVLVEDSPSVVLLSPGTPVTLRGQERG